MSITSRYFKNHSISQPKLTKKKVNRAKKKCGNCIHAMLTKTHPLNGLVNEYNCEVKKCTVLNCDGICEKFINRWKHFLQPNKMKNTKKGT